MITQELLNQLRKLAVENRPFACMGCGYEHNCGVHGCQVIRLAIEKLDVTEEVIASKDNR